MWKWNHKTAMILQFSVCLSRMRLMQCQLYWSTITNNNKCDEGIGEEQNNIQQFIMIITWTLCVCVSLHNARRRVFLSFYSPYTPFIHPDLDGFCNDITWPHLSICWYYTRTTAALVVVIVVKILFAQNIVIILI